MTRVPNVRAEVSRPVRYPQTEKFDITWSAMA